MPDAIAALEQAAALYAEVRDDYNTAQARRDLARSHRSMKNDNLADGTFDQAVVLFERCHEPQEAQATRDEAHPKKRGLPWWVIVMIVLFVVIVVLLILALKFKW
jgi:cytochrome c-type biogenesis protein CcmH/NrfG